MQVYTYNLDLYVRWLKEGRVFSFVRYGNGEWGCILGTISRTPSDSQRLDIFGLRRGLVRGITTHQQDSSYLLAMQSRTYLERVRLLKPVKQWLVNNAPEAQWVCGEVFHKASLKGRFYPLIAQLRRMCVVVVGPVRLRGLNQKVFRGARFVSIRSRNCYENYKNILASILKVRQEFRGPVVISFSAGPAAKVLIHDLHDQIGENTFLIDFGSLWDPYVGRNTRSYHSRVKGAILERNLTGK